MLATRGSSSSSRCSLPQKSPGQQLKPAGSPSDAESLLGPRGGKKKATRKAAPKNRGLPEGAHIFRVKGSQPHPQPPARGLRWGQGEKKQQKTSHRQPTKSKRKTRQQERFQPNAVSSRKMKTGQKAEKKIGDEKRKLRASAFVGGSTYRPARNCVENDSGKQGERPERERARPGRSINPACEYSAGAFSKHPISAADEFSACGITTL